MSTKQCASIVGSSYIFELHRSINSRWAVFGLCHYCTRIQRTVFSEPLTAACHWSLSSAQWIQSTHRIQLQ